MNVEQTLAERGSRYGDFSIHAEIAKSLQDDMRQTKGWKSLSPVQKQALTMIADKIARILSGDPCYADNWHDIQGYAKLVEDRVIDVSEDPAKQFKGSLPGHQGNPNIDEAMKRAARPGVDCLVCGAPNGHGGLPCPNTGAYCNSNS